MNTISSSYGNDSCAMIQWAHENQLDDVTVVYCDTGWATPDWMDRVTEMEKWVKSLGFKTERITPDMQFVELITHKKGFPNQQFQWCSGMLKGVPFLNWIDEVDKDLIATVMVGKRRDESEARKDTPCVVISEYHGGRLLIHPLYKHTEDDRNELLERAGIEVLPHRSYECHPCVNANRQDMRNLTDEDIKKVESLELIVGKNMFRSKKWHGAQGIREVVDCAKYSSGQYNPDQDDLLGDVGCGSPFGCGL